VPSQRFYACSFVPKLFLWQNFSDCLLWVSPYHFCLVPFCSFLLYSVLLLNMAAWLSDFLVGLCPSCVFTPSPSNSHFLIQRPFVFFFPSQRDYANSPLLFDDSLGGTYEALLLHGFDLSGIPRPFFISSSRFFPSVGPLNIRLL